MQKIPRTVVAGNWKMHGSLQTLTEYVRGLAQALSSGTLPQVVLFPPTGYLAPLRSMLVDAQLEERVMLGGQDLHTQPEGAFTGDTSGAMLADLGAQWVLVGHSERRQYHGEGDQTVAEKAAAALLAGLTPVVCVGESAEERDAGDAEAVVRRQISVVSEHLGAADMKSCVIAYEPVWAIGTGRTATAETAAAMHAVIRALLSQGMGADAQAVTLLYGGSVKAANAQELFAQADINGGLVGGASLDAKEFAAIIAAGAHDG
jgi:triosephosphate isomerase